MHIEETRPVSGHRRVDEIEEAKEATLNEVCLLCRIQSPRRKKLEFNTFQGICEHGRVQGVSRGSRDGNFQKGGKRVILSADVVGSHVTGR